MKQCVSCVGSVFEVASATICAVIVAQLELECTDSEGSRKSGSEVGRYLWQQGSWLFSQKGTVGGLVHATSALVS